ncbi:MAG: hypothetical protein HYW15_01295 [Candidatus Giovannonibacteria bacterium]|nr:MAG: hypothetical protein HYW15_01295 [Candidatus Giovannonibacteria bacterium]
MRPKPEELNQKIWYRIFKVVAVSVFVGAFIAPWIVHEPNIFLLIDSAINALIWLILLFVIRAVILYTIYGKREAAPEERKRIWEWVIWGTASFILIVGFLAAVIYWFF